MDYQSYLDYLKSPEWKIVKRRYYGSRLFGGYCYCCEESKPLQLHHKTYRRLKSERLSDLIALCNDCHKLVHEIVKDKTNRTTLWGAARRLRRFLGNAPIKESKQRRKKQGKKKKKKNYDNYYLTQSQVIELRKYDRT